jgi:hypothetical protein
MHILVLDSRDLRKARPQTRRARAETSCHTMSQKSEQAFARSPPPSSRYGLWPRLETHDRRRCRLRTTVTIAGFPAANCAATSATVEPINSQAGTKLLSQWRSIGMEGAWYLPPQLGTAKLLSVVNAPQGHQSTGLSRPWPIRAKGQRRTPEPDEQLACKPLWTGGARALLRRASISGR